MLKLKNHFEMKIKLIISFILLILLNSKSFSQCPAGGAVFINEMYNDGSIEYLELLVVGDPSSPTAPVNLEGWIIDDNNINQVGMGTATGHLILNNQFSSINPGAIILIYNESNPFSPLPANNPPWLYVVKGNDIGGCSNSPAFNNSNYTPCGTSGGSWGYIALATSGDIAQTRNASTTFYHALRYSSVNVMPDVLALDVPDKIGLDCGDWFDADNYTITTQTPGAANSIGNQLLINAIRFGTLDCANIEQSCVVPCPIIDVLNIDPLAVCEDAEFDLSATGLQNMAQILNTVTDYGIEFVVHPGSTPPADPYIGGTSLGVVPYASLTGTNPDQIATLNNIQASNLGAGSFTICAILTPTPVDPDCQVYQCLPFTISSTPTASLSGTFEFCPDDCHQINTQIQGGTQPYEANFTLSIGAFNIPFNVPGYDVNNQLTICYSGSSPFPGYNFATNTLTIPSWLTGTGSLILNNIVSDDGCSASAIDPNNMTLIFKSKLNISSAGPINACDYDFDGEASFDLNTLDLTIINGQNDVSTNWFEDMNCSSPISDPGSFTTGTTTVYVYVSHNNDEKCNSDTLAVQLNVIVIPNPGESGEFTICSNEPCVNFWVYLGGNADQDGNWNDDDATGVDLDFPHCVEFFDVAGGTYTFTYSTQDPAGLCSEAMSVLTITVSEPGNPGADNADVFCGAPANPVNLVSYLNNDFTPGGTWTTSSPFAISDPTNVDMSSANVDTYYFYYTIENEPCDPVFSTITIQVINEPNAGTDDSVSVCNDGPNTVLNLDGALGAHDLNGEWIDNDGSGVDLDNPDYVDFGGVPSGVYHFTYIIYQNGTCPEVTAVITVTVGSGAFAGTDGSDAICQGSTQLIDLYLYLGSNFDAGGNWTQLSGNFVSLSDPHNVSFSNSQEGIYNFQYAVNGACGTDVALITITINSSLNAGLDYTYTSCQDNTVNLYDSLLNYKLGGYWIDEYNNLVTNPLKIKLDSVKTYIFKYVFAEANGCPNDTAIATITTLPAINAGSDGSLILCQGSQGSIDLFSYVGQPYNSGGEWWNINNGVSITSSNIVSFTSSPVGLDTFMYIVSGACGIDTAFVIANITTSPNAGDDYIITVCQNSLVNLFDSLKNYSFGGDWYDDNGIKINDPTKVLLDEIKSYFFKYKIPASGSCLADSAFVEIITLSAPYAGIAIDFSLCHGHQNNIDFFDFLSGDYTTGGIWKYNAVFGVPNPRNYNFSTFAVGTYSYSYIVGSNANCPGDTTTLIVTIEPAPNAGTDALTDVCNSTNSSINLENLIGNHDITGIWEKPAGNPVNISNPQNVSFTNISSGKYLFYYVIQTNGICPADTATVEINVFKKLFAGNDKTLSLCETDDSKVKIIEQLQPDPNLEYIIEDVNQTQSIDIPTLEIDLSKLNIGTYTFILIVGQTDICGPDSSTLIINIIKAPQAGTNANLTVCNDESNVNLDVLLGIHDAGGTWIDVDNSGVQIQPSNGKNVTFNNVLMGTYRYTYRLAAIGSCPESSATITVNVNPVSQFNLTRDICQGENITVNGNIYNLNNPVGTETLTNIFGCDSIVNISLKAKAVSALTSDEDENCFGFGKFLVNNLSGIEFPATLSIDGIGDYQITGVPYTVINIPAGIYNYDITDINGCGVMDNTFEILNFIPYEINIDVTNLEESYKLTVNTDINPDNIIWTPTEGLSCSDCLITYAKPLHDQQYIIEITDKEGCTVIDTVELRRIINIELDIPNIFSPDGDGKNDRFYIKCNDCDYQYTMYIFDRWGEKVFYAENIRFNDNAAGWDGRFRDKKTNPGVYVYLIEINKGNGEKEVMAGDVLLIK